MAARPHPFIVSLRYAFQDDRHLFILLDYVGGGDLFRLLAQKGKLPEDWARACLILPLPRSPSLSRPLLLSFLSIPSLSPPSNPPIISIPPRSPVLHFTN